MATYVVKSKHKEYTVEVVDSATGGATVTIDDASFEVAFVSGDGHAVTATPAAAPVAAAAPAPRVATAPPPSGASAPTAPPAAAGAGAVPAPIPGKVIGIHVSVGASVQTGETVLTLEAMKMENAIAAPISGTVKEISINEGGEVAAGQLLMTIE